MTLSIRNESHYAEYHYAFFRMFLIAMLSVIVLSVIMLSVVAPHLPIITRGWPLKRANRHPQMELEPML
jgi:hypothetical protein